MSALWRHKYESSMTVSKTYTSWPSASACQAYRYIVHCKFHQRYFNPTTLLCLSQVRRAWWYQRGNQNPYIEEEQTTQWPKEKVQKDKQQSTKHTYKTKDRVTPLKFGGELRCSGRVSSSCSTSDIRRVNLVTNQVISHERGKDHWNLHTLYCS